MKNGYGELRDVSVRYKTHPDGSYVDPKCGFFKDNGLDVHIKTLIVITRKIVHMDATWMHNRIVQSDI